MLIAIEEHRQQEATDWMHTLEQTPMIGGKLVAKSGRIRHCHTFAGVGDNLSSRTKDAIMTALGRECRNFFLQESVAAVAARALKGCIDFGRKFGLKGYVSICLYDSIVCVCPYHERKLWAKALELYMHLANGWCYGDRILRYTIDCEYNEGWSQNIHDKDMNDKLKSDDWEPLPSELQYVDNWLDAMIDLYTTHPELSVYNSNELPKDMSEISLVG